MRLFALAVCLLPLSLVSLAGREDKPSSDWLHWRGPSEQGYVADKNVPLIWSEDKNLLWKTKLPGDGHSSPIVLGDRIFLTGATEKGKERLVFCVSASTGKILWQETAVKDVEKEATHAWHGWASPSCVTDGKRVYAFFGTPGIFCYDLDGKFVWKKSFGTFVSKAGWGTAASPYIYKDTVIVNCDNDGGKAGAAPSALVALDLKTGDVKWTTPRDQGRGYGTPRLMKMDGGRIDLVLNGPQGVWGYDPESGKERWRCTRSDPGDQHQFGEPLPVEDGKRMFILSGRTGPYQVVKLPGSGDVTKTHVEYTTKRGKRDVASPILVDGLVYCVDRGSLLTVFELKTGKSVATLPLTKRKGPNSMASPLLVRGKLLWTLDEGTTVVVEPGKEPKIVGVNKLPGETLDYGASPAVSAGKLYLRSRSYLYCVGEKK